MGPPARDRAVSPRRRRELIATIGSSVAVGLAGCGYNADADSDEPILSGETITVGVLAPERMAFGQSLQRGAEFAVERLNADGGIAGASLELETATTDFDPKRARSEHERLCGTKDCDLTLGLTLRGELEATLPSIAAHETVHLTTGAFSRVAGETVADDYDTYRYHFRPGLPNYRQLADAVTEFVATNADALGWERAAINVENLQGLTPYFDRLRERVAEHLDVRVAARRTGLQSPTLVYNEAEAEDCDVLLGGYLLSGASAINLWAQQERSFAFGGLLVPSTSTEFWERTEGRAESVFSLTAVTPRLDNTGRTREFVADYAHQYGRYPMYSGALTYDALRLYREAVEGIVDEDDAELPSQEQIVEALEAVTFTDGVVYPEFEFTAPDAEAAHEPVWESMAESGGPVVQQWQTGDDGDGVIETIAPGENQTAPYQPPPWIDQ